MMVNKHEIIESFQPVWKLDRIDGRLFEVMDLPVPEAWMAPDARWYLLMDEKQWKVLKRATNSETVNGPGWVGAGAYLRARGKLIPLISLWFHDHSGLHKAYERYADAVRRQAQEQRRYAVRWRDCTVRPLPDWSDPVWVGTSSELEANLWAA